MVNEKDVENYYRTYLLKLFPNSIITSPFKTDGILEFENLKILLEFKYDLDFTVKDNKVIAIIQALCYMKRMENKGEKLPSIIFIGDKNECFVLHSNDVLKHLSLDLDWSVAPSNAFKLDGFKSLRLSLNDDNTINPFVFNHDDKSVLDKINDLHTKVSRKIRLTNSNIENVYKYFIDKKIVKQDLDSNAMANLFIQIIINPSANYKHPKKKNLLVTESLGEIKINSEEFDSFFQHFEGDLYSLREKKELINQVDRLIEDSVRRKKGEFYTPKIWVDKAHSYLEETFGEDWKDKYVVFDNSCGTGALTKDYKFNSLIQTTIEQSDIDTMNQAGFNKGSIKQQLDFINDGIPESIIEVIKGREVIVLMNPPYKTAGNNKRDSEADEGVAESKARTEMIAAKWSGYGQLYAQFIYRSLKLKEHGCKVHLAVFAPPLYLSSSSFKVFRNKMFKDVSYKKGFMFKANEFSGTANNWSIVFGIFKSK